VVEAAKSLYAGVTPGLTQGAAIALKPTTSSS